jgi:predicted nucleic acid-binding protein
MRERLVVDASAVVAIVRGEPEQADLERILTDRVRARSPLIAPANIWLEIVNSLVRRHRLLSRQVLEAIQRIDSFGVATIDVDRSLVVLTLDLAERYGLTAYDAAYLALARTEDADLLTLDDELALAAGDRAVPIGDDHRLHETPAVYEHQVTWPMYKEASAYLAKLRADALRGQP